MILEHFKLNYYSFKIGLKFEVQFKRIIIFRPKNFRRILGVIQIFVRDTLKMIFVALKNCISVRRTTFIDKLLESKR